MIKPEHWGDDQHTTLYMWDNVASGCADSVQLNPKQEGRVKIAITKTAVNSLITVIVYGELENMMQMVGGEKTSLGGEYVGGEIVPWWRVRWWRVSLVAR